MGVLDEAIREHLDLKRRRGADPTEIERAEREALGPARREANEAPEDEPDAAAESDFAEDEESAGEQTAHGGGLYDVEDEDPEWEEPSRSSRPLARAESTPADGDEDHEQSTQLHDTLMGDPEDEEDFFGEESFGWSRRSPPEDFSVSGSEPTPAHEDYEPDSQGSHQEAPGATPSPPPHRAPETAEHPDAGPGGAGLTAGAAGPAALSDETVEYSVHDEEGATQRGEDVLEETPEFLQDTPDHDRLWFEQRPPRDFDFEG